MSVTPSWLASVLLERNLLPDAAIRAGIRRVIAARLRAGRSSDAATAAARLRSFAGERRAGPIAGAVAFPVDDVPLAFYRLALGRRMAYSSACWDDETRTLDEAEENMLALVAERAGLGDGQRILELGSGWGPLALWVARRYPRARVVAVSNVPAHKVWMDEAASREGVVNLEAITADLNAFDTADRFDRVVAIEIFEHLRNWHAILANISRWLDDDGRVFLQIGTRGDYAAPFEQRDRSDWLAAYFFAGGVLPAEHLLREFQDDLVIREQWTISGRHYQRTIDAWLENVARQETAVREVLASAYGAADGRHRLAQWRVFLMTCAEIWGWRGGEEWRVAHYALAKRAGR